VSSRVEKFEAMKTLKAMKKVKKIGSKLVIGLAWYFCVGFFNIPNPNTLTELR
jgi:hypothetical protein